MSEQEKLIQAQAVFETICRAFDKKEWKYEKNEEKLRIECASQGEDLPMELTVRVNPERMLLQMFSHIPFTISEDMRVDMAIAVSAINNLLVDGCFDYDIVEGHIFFRMAVSFLDSTVSEELFLFMVACAFKVIDDYNDKFFMISKGMLSIEKFLESLAE